MEIRKTEAVDLTDREILSYISDYDSKEVPQFGKLWKYYKGKNTTIINRKSPDPNNPDNKTPVSYARKIIRTYTGYAYRPGYITYKSDEKDYMHQIQATFDLNKENIKTHRAGRNTGIFGVAYELFYTDKVEGMAEPKFFPVDPREMILLYDYAPEPMAKIGIRYYPINDFYRVEVYYADHTVVYNRKNSHGDWRLEQISDDRNFYDTLPIVAYYLSDDLMGIIEPVLPLIDNFDLLVSDSLNEFDRFANAYLKLVKFSLTDPTQNKDPGMISRALQMLKRRRIFENLPSSDAVSFLTKDIPKDFMEFMTELIRNQIHIQSHVPDFADKTFSTDISGVAVRRLLFDFENLVSSAEADFDNGLKNRLELINKMYAKQNRPVGNISEITISHKRNLPADISEFAETARIMKEAGFSAYLIADVMPDDVIPDVETELERQKAGAPAFDLEEF